MRKLKGKTETQITPSREDDPPKVSNNHIHGDKLIHDVRLQQKGLTNNWELSSYKQDSKTIERKLK